MPKLIALVSILTLLTACASSGIKLGEPIPPQAVPADLRSCFDRLVPMPKQATLTAGEVMALIASLKRSELEKSQCGKRLLAWVDRH